MDPSVRRNPNEQLDILDIDYQWGGTCAMSSDNSALGIEFFTCIS